MVYFVLEFLLVRSDNREDSVSNATADFHDLEARFRFIIFEKEFWKLGEEPVAIFEELIVMDVIELVPKFIRFLLEVFSFFLINQDTGVFLNFFLSLHYKFLIPFNIVPLIKINRISMNISGHLFQVL